MQRHGRDRTGLRNVFLVVLTSPGLEATLRVVRRAPALEPGDLAHPYTTFRTRNPATSLSL